MGEQPALGRAELELLQFLTEHPPASVREVVQEFGVARGYARTTVLTMMERLREKGFLTRRKVGGVFRYAPNVSKAELLRNLVTDFVEKTLGGSLSPFVAYLSRGGRVRPEELQELKRLVAVLEADQEEER